MMKVNVDITCVGPSDALTRFWVVRRMQKPDGEVHPMWLTFRSQVRATDVAAYIIKQQLARNREWTPFVYFDLDPAPKEGWAEYTRQH